jgi:hypothetical protein
MKETMTMQPKHHEVKGNLPRKCEEFAYASRVNDSMGNLEAFRNIRRMAENGQLPDLTLDEINEEIRLAREEIAARKKNAVDAGDSEKGRCSIE